MIVMSKKKKREKSLYFGTLDFTFDSCPAVMPLDSIHGHDSIQILIKHLNFLQKKVLQSNILSTTTVAR